VEWRRHKAMAGRTHLFIRISVLDRNWT